MIVFHDPWDALCLAEALPGRRVATFGGDRQRELFSALGLEPILLPAEGKLQTTTLLADPRVDPGDERVICFKPSARLEAFGYRLAHAPATLAQGLENKLKLREIAAEAGVLIADQDRARVGDASFDELVERFGLPFVAQSPRGHAGGRSYKVDHPSVWTKVEQELTGRPVKVASWVEGRPGTSNAVVDSEGRVLVSAPILQLTGEKDLSPNLLGSCGNDFHWRPTPHPGTAAEELAEALGPALAARGYRGHFGIDWVYDGERCTLIEINARLTASFGLYIREHPDLLHAHLEALEGSAIRGGRLTPFEGGQLVAYNLTDQPASPLEGAGCWPHPGKNIAAGAKRGRMIVDGPVVDAGGGRVAFLPG
ncbi:MAG: ATP-grasp domain-containing protein [Myxococcota bacterium]|nr:ATP-grasp domain-containing protein [Myxococcota bacterium]